MLRRPSKVLHRSRDRQDRTDRRASLWKPVSLLHDGARFDGDMEEKRISQRRRSLKGGRIVFNGGASTINCTIRNLSEDGAQLLVESTIGIPSEFTLMFDHGSARSCVMRWKHANTLGVAFL